MENENRLNEMKKILRRNKVLEFTGLSASTVWRLEKEGNFPERVQLGGRNVGWFASEIKDYIESRPRGINRNSEG